MRKTRRKINRERKKFKIITVFVLSILIIGVLVGSFFYYKKTTASRFISPIPENYDIAAYAGSQKQIDILKEKLRERGIEFDEVKKGNNNFVIALDDQKLVIFSREKDIATQIASLQFILTRLTMEGRTFQSLDLRYDKPIIRE